MVPKKSSTNDGIPVKKVAALIAKYESRSFKGPLPPPDVLARYEEIHSGLADRIVKMAEQQSTHRQRLEKEVVESNIANEKQGMNFAFIITIVFVLLSGFLIYFDKTVAGYITLGTIIIGHAYNYLNQEKKENTLAPRDKKLVKGKKK